MDVVILAAGQGKRMRSDLPKVLHPLAGKPLLAHVLGTARGLGARSICVVYGHGGEKVPEAFPGETDIGWARQEPQLGTGHAIQQALPLLGDDGLVLVLYGDVPLIAEATLMRLIAAADSKNHGGKLAILTVELEDPSGYGRIVRDAAGQVDRIVEEKDASPAQRAIREINTGIMAIPPLHLRRWLGRIENNNAQREYYLTDIVALAVEDGIPVETVRPTRVWETLGVNSKAQLAELERILQGEIASRLLEQGVTLADPARIDVRGELVCGRDVEIDINCVFEGRVELGEGVRVGAHCVLRNVKVGAGTRIAPFSLLEDSELGMACRIGPFSRLRPGSVLAEDVHVGNFVEVKNSRIAAHSKANHLSYVGDATVGSQVNIGAGTITCNYDGANKYRTVIEDGAFIGSDTQLVAPVTVGRGATLGAGTTLVQDAPPGALTLSRAQQVTVAGWKRPVKKR
jgi:bifunctional UDP-N-acetylglucosamine pyrophosphorylase / glucosamine-1-phosphate N-acetyltransferase